MKAHSNNCPLKEAEAIPSASYGYHDHLENASFMQLNHIIQMVCVQENIGNL